MTRGIVRRIDELGRVVIPKELRRTLQIKDGEQLEITVGSQGELTLKKYSHFGENKHVVDACANTLRATLHKEVAIFDTQQVIAHVGGDKCYEEEHLSSALTTVLEIRKPSKLSKKTAIIRTDTREYKDQFVVPIVINGELFGGIMIIGDLSQEELRVVTTVGQCLQELLG